MIGVRSGLFGGEVRTKPASGICPIDEEDPFVLAAGFFLSCILVK